MTVWRDVDGVGSGGRGSGGRDIQTHGWPCWYMAGTNTVLRASILQWKIRKIWCLFRIIVCFRKRRNWPWGERGIILVTTCTYLWNVLSPCIWLVLSFSSLPAWTHPSCFPRLGWINNYLNYKDILNVLDVVLSVWEADAAKVVDHTLLCSLPNFMEMPYLSSPHTRWMTLTFESHTYMRWLKLV